MNKKQVLLVEGKDDFHVFATIFEKYTVEESFKIKDEEGIDNILNGLSIYVKTDIQTIGVVIDADEDIRKRWQSLTSILQDIGYKVPEMPDTLGTIITSEHLPKFGVWLMPNNQENGMLEDFINYLVPENDELMSYVEEVLRKIEEKGLQKYKTNHKIKAKIHTWLSWQESPGTPLGQAITKSYLNPHHDLCKQFVNWINKLYN